MKLLTFLGIGRYSETVYTWQDQECRSAYAPVASCTFLKPDQLIVFLTEDAQEKVFPAFQAALPRGVALHTAPIPLGRSENELWQVFNQISEAVKPGEEVAFDITHGLRSSPLLALLAAAYLRTGRDVRLKAVLYGAFDVRDQSVEPNRTSMFDLSPMISLLEWAAAADRFTRTGDSRYLGALLKAPQKSMALQAGKDHARLEAAGQLGRLSSSLAGISMGLHLIRPHLVMEQVARLAEQVEAARPTLEQAASARPFALLLEEIIRVYSPLAQVAPRQCDVWRTLAVERGMIQWYAEHELWVQAVSLAREWLVSWVMAQLGMQTVTQLNDRQRIENVVNSEANAYKEAKKAEQPFQAMFLRSLPGVEAVMSLWLALTGVRNDIDHAGMRDDPETPENLVKSMLKCFKQIEALPLGRPEV